MRNSSDEGIPRREFLRRAAFSAALPTLVPRVLGSTPRAAAAAIEGPAPLAAPGYLALTSAEAAFTEAMVSAMCPADHLTPDGVSCGLAAYVDRRLAGDLGVQPFDEKLNRRQAYRAAVTAVNAASRKRFGCPVKMLDPTATSAFLGEVASGRFSGESISLATWFHDLVDPLLQQACLADPLYHKYSNRVFWKIFG